jgi:signal transduction histidine kinase
LRASRQRIVTAREGLRQRLVGTIHDRVELRLEAIEATLDKVDRCLEADPQAALRHIDAAATEGGLALDALRDLARGIFPPLLADRGVIGALEAHAAKAELSLRIHTGGLADGQRFDAQAETTIYFCLVEGLREAARSAPGAATLVRLDARNGRVAFSVVHDAPGTLVDGVVVAAPDAQGMRDRVEAVGGAMEVQSDRDHALVVSGWVPARAVEPAALQPA